MGGRDALKAALIQATERWMTLRGEGESAACPVAFDAEDVHETMGDKLFEVLQDY
jgi:hypothetical protein